MKPYATLHRLADGRLSVTDWNGKEHKFRSIDRAIAYAGSLYKNKPKRVQAEKAVHPRWGKNWTILTNHPERRKFSHGRVDNGTR